MEANLEIFADNVKHLMQQKGLQPSDYTSLAVELDIEPPRVKRWLDAQCYPKHEMMIRLMKYFGLNDYQRLLTQRIGVKNQTVRH